MARGVAEDVDAFSDLVATPTQGRSLDSRWRYRADGAVFGPIEARELLELLYEGELDAATQVAPEDGEFLPLARFGAFRAHVEPARRAVEARRAAEARAKAERSAWMARRLRWAAMVAVVASLGALGVSGFVAWRRGLYAESERSRREAQLREERDQLLASVSIEPPLVPLVSDAPRTTPPREATEAKRGRPRRKAAEEPSRRGVLGDDEVIQGLNRAFPGLVACIKDQLRRDPESVPGRVVLGFSIDNDGRARNVELKDRFLRRSELGPCIEGKLAAARWRAFEGEVRNVEYPITVRRPEGASR